MNPLMSRALGIGLGVLADSFIPDPATHHPVAWFGSAASGIETITYRDSRDAGGIHVAICVVPVAMAGWLVERYTALRWWLHLGATALTTWAVVGIYCLAREGLTMASFLDNDDLASARAQLSHLCGRDPDHLDHVELARATVESVAENTADAGIASVMWAALAGIPGLVTHRCINTLDAMIGHKNTRYLRFGTVAATLDDWLDWIPARTTGVLFSLLAPVVHGSSDRAWQITMRDHAKHPSPNGGWCESAMAGALGVQLGGTNIYYGNRIEHRGRLGDGSLPKAGDARRSVNLSRWAMAIATAGTIAGLGIVAGLTRLTKSR